ncbi:hypothetical protein [Sorangium sp. So ce1153]|uniref:hypothetical protein n=1 Tax=Sorangium sp. So ce1153 TaxID=3133333 RepID=UPI003F602EAF
MSESGPRFYAWCEEASRVDAFAAALSALVQPGWLIGVSMYCDAACDTTSMEEAAAMIRAHFKCGGGALVRSSVLLRASQRFVLPDRRGPDFYLGIPVIDFGSCCCAEAYERLNARGPREPQGPLEMSPDENRDFFRFKLELAWGRGPRSIEAEAEVAWHIMQVDLEDLLLRLCAPDGSGRVRTGACTNAWHWNAPVATCATYNADAREIARDLAVSWVHLHDKDSVSRIAGMSLAALHARVDAAPAGARVPLKGGGERAHSLSRETVLKALAAPPSALLEALEAAAVPDEAWRAAAPRAAEILGLTSQLAETGEGPPTWPVYTDTYRHIRFLKKHPPFVVRRLPTGGVVLLTHPYCSLWPLWANALCSLGLMS